MLEFRIWSRSDAIILWILEECGRCFTEYVLKYKINKVFYWLNKERNEMLKNGIQLSKNIISFDSHIT